VALLMVANMPHLTRISTCKQRNRIECPFAIGRRLQLPDWRARVIRIAGVAVEPCAASKGPTVITHFVCLISNLELDEESSLSFPDATFIRSVTHSNETGDMISEGTRFIGR
jgi:uncharacterized protein with PQ loop repeat